MAHEGADRFWYRILFCIDSVSIKKEHKRKMLCPEVFCAQFCTTAPFFVSDTCCIPSHFLHHVLSLPRSGESAVMTEWFIFAKVSHQVSSVGRHGRQLCLAERVTDLRLGAQQVCSGTSWNTCSRFCTARVSMLGDVSLHSRGTDREEGEDISNHYVCLKAFAFLPLKLTISSSCCTQRRIWSSHIGIHCMLTVKHVHYLELLSNKRKCCLWNTIKECQLHLGIILPECHCMFLFLGRLNQLLPLPAGLWAVPHMLVDLTCLSQSVLRSSL